MEQEKYLSGLRRRVNMFVVGMGAAAFLGLGLGYLGKENNYSRDLMRKGAANLGVAALCFVGAMDNSRRLNSIMGGRE